MFDVFLVTRGAHIEHL